MTTEEIICNAIKNRFVIQFNYEGHQRLIEPFTLGYHKDTGNLVLSGYRVGGYTKSHSEPPWRLFKVNQMSGIGITDQKAATFRDDYNPNDSRMSQIICTY
ncbi:MAG: WYL domain-containing protein [Clostridiaceae bacterium]|jgi:predicted DNA-binding transcriptional regulator YafY|nr:WYL domain-containing protein [Clostridiaceae bacterium]